MDPRSFSEMHDNEQGPSSCTVCEFTKNHDAHRHDYMPNDACARAHMRWRFPVACKGKMDPQEGSEMQRGR